MAYLPSACGRWTLLVAMLRSPKVRSNTFNFYIVFCLGPDTLYFPLMFIINLCFLLDAMRVLATEDEYISIYTSQMAKVCMQLYA